MFSNRSDQGRSLRQLLQHPHTEPRTVRTRTTRKTARRLEPDEALTLVKAYQGGATTYELADRHRINRGTVSTILERHGVSRRYNLLDGDKLAQTVALYKAGESLAHIGAQLGISRSTVSRELKRAGVQLRPRPGWAH
jgi:DNA-binding CsgD family transcriptional regulator